MIAIFDWDGSLVDVEYVFSERIAALATDHGFPIDADTVFQKFSGLCSEDKFRGIAQHCGKFISNKTVSLLRKQHSEIKKALYEETSLSHVFEHVAEALTELQKNHTLAIASNGQLEPLVLAIDRVGFTQFFNDRVYTPDSVGVPSKPHPGMLTHAMERAGQKPGEAFFVGDTAADPKAARAAGIPRRVAFISPRYQKPAIRERIMKTAGATHFFSDYSDLPALVAS